MKAKKQWIEDGLVGRTSFDQFADCPPNDRIIRREFGMARILWLVPLVGERMAELLEIPVIVAVFTILARYLVNRWRKHLTLSATLASGTLALAILVTVELTVVLAVRGLTWTEHFDTRDPIAGAVHAASLLLFAVMPSLSFLLGRKHPVS